VKDPPRYRDRKFANDDGRGWLARWDVLAAGTDYARKEGPATKGQAGMVWQDVTGAVPLAPKEIEPFT